MQWAESPHCRKQETSTWWFMGTWILNEYTRGHHANRIQCVICMCTLVHGRFHMKWYAYCKNTSSQGPPRPRWLNTASSALPLLWDCRRSHHHTSFQVHACLLCTEICNPCFFSKNWSKNVNNDFTAACCALQKIIRKQKKSKQWWIFYILQFKLLKFKLEIETNTEDSVYWHSFCKRCTSVMFYRHEHFFMFILMFCVFFSSACGNLSWKQVNFF